MEQKKLNKSIGLLPLFTDDKRLLYNLVGAYTDFPDKPYLDNHYFLMYDCKTIKELKMLENVLLKNKYFFNITDIRIDNKYYFVAILKVVNDSNEICKLTDRYDSIKRNTSLLYNGDTLKKLFNLFKGSNYNINDIFDSKDLNCSLPINEDIEIEIEY